MTETEAIDYEIDYREIIFSHTVDCFRVYYPIFHPGKEVLVMQM
jgi:hypothetical protein